MHHLLKVGLAQIAPVWMHREATLTKVCDYLEEAGKQGCELVCFGEGLVPGYPFWLSYTDGARFNASDQKEMYALYLQHAVQITRGDLDIVCQLASQYSMAVILGIIENPIDRGGHSLYCTAVYINENGAIISTHRKLVPTYEERLVWAQGDGAGLQTHSLKAFKVGALNCWENWMPLARTALYAQGENLHVALWPGGVHNTQDLTRFIALESRSFVISISGLMWQEHISTSLPFARQLYEKAPEILANGGSCIASPDGTWLLSPQVNHEQLLVAMLDVKKVWEERQNFDPTGHYARPDVLQLKVNKNRQSSISFEE